MKTVTTPKGTTLPLANLKGKDYLLVAHRLQWFNETETNFRIETDFLLVNEDQTVARAIVTVFDKEGKEIKRASATKRETKKDFSDHTEKAETSAVGRALAMLGYGTQFAISDLDEGDRIVDSPVVDARGAGSTSSVTPLASTTSALESAVTASSGKAGSFRKPVKKQTEMAAGAESDGWE